MNKLYPLCVMLVVFVGPLTTVTTLSAETVRTNVAEVIKLLEGGVDEDVITLKLRKEGTQFDLSADQLLQLKQAGATSKLLKVMLDTKAPEVDADRASSTNQAGEIDGTFWLKAGAEKHPLTQAHAELVAKAGMLSLVTDTVTAYLVLSRSGPSAKLRVTDRSIRFGEIAVLPHLRVEEIVQLVRLEVDSEKHRRLQVAKGGGIRGAKMATPSKIPVVFDYLREAKHNGKLVRIYSARNSEPLTPGEYAIWMGGKALFDFGVD